MSIPQKRCTRCGDERPLAEFIKGPRYADGYQPWCKACRDAYRRQYYAQPDHKEAMREYQQAYLSDPMRRERLRAQNRANYHDPAKHEQIKTKRQAYDRERWRTDPAVRARKNAQNRVKHHKRRTRLADAGSYTVAEWDALCAKYDHRCLCCGERLPLAVDHVVPVSKGGRNTIDNLQPLCTPCNSRKSNKTIDYRPKD